MPLVSRGGGLAEPDLPEFCAAKAFHGHCDERHSTHPRNLFVFVHSHPHLSPNSQQPDSNNQNNNEVTGAVGAVAGGEDERLVLRSACKALVDGWSSPSSSSHAAAPLVEVAPLVARICKHPWLL